MHRITKRAIQMAAGTAVAAVGTLALVSPAFAAPGWTFWEQNYYSSKGSCENAGDWIIGAPPFTKPGIAGTDKYRCYKNSGYTKYSMKIHWTNLD